MRTAYRMSCKVVSRMETPRASRHPSFACKSENRLLNLPNMGIQIALRHQSLWLLLSECKGTNWVWRRSPAPPSHPAIIHSNEAGRETCGTEETRRIGRGWRRCGTPAEAAQGR